MSTSEKKESELDKVLALVNLSSDIIEKKLNEFKDILDPEYIEKVRENLNITRTISNGTKEMTTEELENYIKKNS